MKERVINLVGNKLDNLNVHIYDVVYEKEGKNNYLRVVLDSEEMIDIDKVVEATKIIDPLLENENII